MASKRQTNNSLKLILSTGLIVALYGLLQRLGIDKHIWVQDVQNRVFSTLGQPNWLAAYLLMLIPISMTLSLSKNISKKLSHLCYLTSSLYFLTLLYTKSRSGLAGFTVTFTLFCALILLKKGLKKFPIKKILFQSSVFGLTLLFVGSYLTPSIKQILNQSSSNQPAAPTVQTDQPLGAPAITLGGSKSSDIRKVVWQGAIDVWRHYPIFGSGVETFAYSYYNFRPIEHNYLSEWDYLYNKAHNEFLNFLATTGAVGLAAYLLIILWFTTWTLKHLKSDPSHLLAALLAGFAGLAVSNFFGFSVVPVALFFFLWPALAFNLSKQPATATPPTPKAVHTPPYIPIILVTLATTWTLFKIINLWQADRIFNLGRNYLKSNQITSAYQYLQKSVEMSPNEPLFRSYYSEAAAQLAVFYHQQVDQIPEVLDMRDQIMHEAIANSDIVIDQNSVHLNYWKSRAKIFFFLTEINPQYQQNALEALQTSIKIAPTNPKLYYNLALLQNQMNQLQLAQQTLEQTIELKPGYEAARFALGSLYQQLNQPDQAKLHYQYILDNLNPDNEKVREKLHSL